MGAPALPRSIELPVATPSVNHHARTHTPTRQHSIPHPTSGALPLLPKDSHQPMLPHSPELESLPPAHPPPPTHTPLNPHVQAPLSEASLAESPGLSLASCGPASSSPAGLRGAAQSPMARERPPCYLRSHTAAGRLEDPLFIN